MVSYSPTVLITILFILLDVAHSIAIRKLPAIDRSTEKSKSVFREFLNSAVSGAISCSVTHSLVCPLDVVKTRIQTDVTLAGKSTIESLRIIVKVGGKRVLLQGLAATFSGYAVQGFCKFGFYELIKSKVFAIIADPVKVNKYRLPILLMSSGLAEVVASWALCPMEATRIFMVMHPDLKGGMFSAMQVILQKEGLSGLFKGLPMIMLRQVPYTCAKLAGYEIISGALKKSVARMQRKRRLRYVISSSSSATEDLMNPPSGEELKGNVFIQLSSGILAGVLAATISQPADVLLSKICGGSDSIVNCVIISGPISLFQTFKDLGFCNCYAGLQPRAIMIGSLTAMQFIIYEQTKARIQKLKITKKAIVENS